jgi:hypothetical protein
MKSNNEEYLDSLLDSAQKSNNSNPQSALSRMSSTHSSGSLTEGDSGDISALVQNSGGSNKDLNDIGNMLGKLDRHQLVDTKLEDLLDDIETPTDSSIPQFTIGSDPSIDDVRDPEEIALDEAIADAERLDAEIQSGKFDNAPVEEPAAETAAEPEIPQTVSAPIVDVEESDDALLEMAPEVSLPEDNEIVLEKEASSDANETPEEILTDLLDEMSDENLMAPEQKSVQDSLSDVLDNMADDPDMAPLMEDAPKEDPQVEEPQEETQESVDSAPVEAASLDLGMTQEEIDAALSGEPLPEKETTDSADDGLNLDDMSLEDLEAQMDSAIGTTDSQDADVAPVESLEDMMGDLVLTEDNAEPEGASDETSAGEDSEKHGEILLDSMEDEFNLDDMESSLDNLLTGEAADAAAVDGEVSELADAQAGENAGSSDTEEVSMQDLDALMNSLANDELEDIENSAKMGDGAGGEESVEIPKDDILGALTEDGFDDLGQEPSLEDLASIPDRSSSEDESDSDNKGKKAKKEKKKGFFFKTY